MIVRIVVLWIVHQTKRTALIEIRAGHFYKLSSRQLKGGTAFEDIYFKKDYISHSGSFRSVYRYFYDHPFDTWGSCVNDPR